MPLIDLTRHDDARAVLVQSVPEVSEASAEILRNLPRADPPTLDRHTYEVAANALAGALATLIDLVEETDEDDVQLRGALQRWLP